VALGEESPPNPLSFPGRFGKCLLLGIRKGASRGAASGKRRQKKEERGIYSPPTEGGWGIIYRSRSLLRRGARIGGVFIT